MNRTGLATLLIVSAASAVATSDALVARAGETEWVMYAQEANGDVYFYDPARVESIDMVRRVWSGIQYKTSVMGASSFLSLLEINCSERTEKSVQSTFFTDKNWKKAAMKTDKTEKPKKQIAGNDTMYKLLIAVPVLTMLAACDEGSSNSSASAAPTAAQQACLRDVTATTNNPDVVLLSSQGSEAGTLVKVGVGPDRAPWQCIAYSDGTTGGIQSLTDEGFL